MSMSDKMEAAGVGTPAPKTATPVAPSAKAEKKEGAATKIEAFKAIGRAERAKLSEDQKALEGSKRNAVAFVACLGDPARKQSRKTKGVYEESFRVVGYRFKILEDMTIKRAKLSDNCKDLLDVQPFTEEAVKAGTEVNLNVAEAGMLIVSPGFDGAIEGEGKRVYVHPINSQTRKDPYPALRTTEGSIKENMILIAEMEGQVDGKGGTPKLKEGFEDFAPLYKRTKTTRAGSGAKAKQLENVEDAAAAFRKLWGI